MSQQNSGSPLQNYPGYIPAKPPLWKRKWAHVTGASLLAFAIGTSVGGPGEASAPAAARTQETSAASASGSSPKLAAVQDEVARLKTRLSSASTHEKAALAQVRVRAAQSQRTAVKAAKAQVRAQAKVRQQQAVADAVSDAQAEASTSSTSTSSSGGGTDPRFNYCYEANDAGYGSYVQGEDPEYDWYDDNDGDGVVCEF